MSKDLVTQGIDSRALASNVRYHIERRELMTREQAQAIVIIGRMAKVSIPAAPDRFHGVPAQNTFENEAMAFARAAGMDVVQIGSTRMPPSRLLQIARQS